MARERALARKTSSSRALAIPGACCPHVHPPAVLLDPVVPLMFDICEESRWRSLLQASGNGKPAGTSTDNEDIVEYTTVCLGRRHGRVGSNAFKFITS